MNRAHAKLVALERMQYMLSRLKELDEAGLQELEELVAYHEYPGINVALEHERALVRAERERRNKL